MADPPLLASLLAWESLSLNRPHLALTVLLSVTAAHTATGPAVFNVKDFGAVGDGHQLETAALNRAITACAGAGGGTVYLPPGQYLSGTLTLKSHVTLDLDAGATLLASQDPADFPLEEDVWTPGKPILSPLLDAHDATNITLTGRGTIDGQGEVWWKRLELANRRRSRTPTPAETAEAAKVAHGRPHLIRFVRCQDVVIEHLNLRNSPEWNVHPLLCENVRVDDLTIQAPTTSHNTDGVNPESCRNVQVLNCRIDTGDDCVTLKSGQDEAGRRVGRPDENITISGCVMLHGHGGVTIGSEMSGGVRNVTVSNCVFQGTQNGIRIKSQRGRGGVVEAVAVSNIIMHDVPHPFLITMFYTGGSHPEELEPVDAGTPQFRDLLFSNILARGAQDAGSVTGLREMPISGITFSNVHVQAAEGMQLTNAADVRFLDSVIDADRGPAVLQRNCAGIDTARLSATTPHAGIPLVATESFADAARPAGGSPAPSTHQ